MDRMYVAAVAVTVLYLIPPTQIYKFIIMANQLCCQVDLAVSYNTIFYIHFRSYL